MALALDNVTLVKAIGRAEATVWLGRNGKVTRR